MWVLRQLSFLIVPGKLWRFVFNLRLNLQALLRRRSARSWQLKLIRTTHDNVVGTKSITAYSSVGHGWMDGKIQSITTKYILRRVNIQGHISRFFADIKAKKCNVEEEEYKFLIILLLTSFSHVSFLPERDESFYYHHSIMLNVSLGYLLMKQVLVSTLS